MDNQHNYIEHSYSHSENNVLLHSRKASSSAPDILPVIRIQLLEFIAAHSLHAYHGRFSFSKSFHASDLIGTKPSMKTLASQAASWHFRDESSSAITETASFLSQHSQTTVYVSLHHLGHQDLATPGSATSIPPALHGGQTTASATPTTPVLHTGPYVLLSAPVPSPPSPLSDSTQTPYGGTSSTPARRQPRPAVRTAWPPRPTTRLTQASDEGRLDASGRRTRTAWPVR